MPRPNLLTKNESPRSTTVPAIRRTNVWILNKFEIGQYREVFFWLLLLGSWQFLASPGSKNGIEGATGTAAFLLFAWSKSRRKCCIWARANW